MVIAITCAHNSMAYGMRPGLFRNFYCMYTMKTFSYMACGNVSRAVASTHLPVSIHV